MILTQEKIPREEVLGVKLSADLVFNEDSPSVPSSSGLHIASHRLGVNTS